MIKFNQPRYILPLIILPFIYVFYYMYQYTIEEPTSDFQETATINRELPDPFLDENNLKGKFDAFQEAYKNKRNFSAMQEIDRREEKQKAADVYPIKEPEKTVISAYTPSTSRSAVQKRSYVPSAPQELSDYEKQMRMFKEQMSYMDSIFSVDGDKGRSGDVGSQKTEFGSVELEDKKKEREDAANKPQLVEKVNGLNATCFNTIITKKTDLFIKAIIDEDLKVRKDSRIRIRLLEDIMIGEEFIPKGRYLYGLVSAFKPQRVEVHISSLLLDHQIIEVALDIYDLDGMKGLYVPESQFRELAKSMGEDMASGQQLNLDQPPDNQAQLMYGLAKDAFNTTSQAVSKSIRKNKARLKYNTMVYLVNSNKQNKSSKHQKTL